MVEAGGGVSHVVPVFEGFALNHATLKLEGAGQDITHRLSVMLAEEGHNLAVRFRQGIARASKWAASLVLGIQSRARG